MLVNTAINKVNLLANGKGADLVVDSTKYTKILRLLNLYKDVWAQEPGVQWNSLRSLASLSATVSATATYALTTAIIDGTAKLSTQEGDYVRILHTNGINESDYTLVQDSRLYNDGASINNPGGDWVARRGSNLIFPVAFTSASAQFGGTIKVPVYTTPADMVSSTTDPTDVIEIDDPYWIIFMAAAEYVRNDVTKQNQYANLIAQATNAMYGMKENNESQLEEVYNNGQLGAAMGETW